MSVCESSFFLHASHSSSGYLSFMTTNIMDLLSLQFPFLLFYFLHPGVHEAPLGNRIFVLFKCSHLLLLSLTVLALFPVIL